MSLVTRQEPKNVVKLMVFFVLSSFQEFVCANFMNVSFETKLLHILNKLTLLEVLKSKTYYFYFHNLLEFTSFEKTQKDSSTRAIVTLWALWTFKNVN